MSAHSDESDDVDPLIFVIPGYDNLPQHLRRRGREFVREAGSALNTALPPWERYGSSLTSWPGQHTYHQGIPAHIDASTTLTYNGGALLWNQFLARLGEIYNTPARPSGMDAATWQQRGPSVFPYTVRTASVQARAVLIARCGRLIVRGPGRHAVDRVVNPGSNRGMPLNQWGAVVSTAAQQASLSNGTLYLVFSLGLRADLLRTIHMRRWYRDNPNRDPEPDVDASLEREIALESVDRNRNVGHATACFIISRTDWPTTQDDGTYAFNGTYKRVIIYDPSFIHEGIAIRSQSGPFSQALAAGRRPRLRDLLFISTMSSLLFNEDGFVRRSGWVREPGRVLIGGGGNIHPLGACMAMAGNWMQQTAHLIRELIRCRHEFSQSPGDEQRLDAFVQAASNWDSWLVDFVVVTR